MKIRKREGMDSEGNCALAVGDLITINDDGNKGISIAMIMKVHPEGHNNDKFGNAHYEIRESNGRMHNVKPKFPMKIFARANT